MTIIPLENKKNERNYFNNILSAPDLKNKKKNSNFFIKAKYFL